MSWPSKPDGNIQVDGKIINKGIEAIHNAPAVLWMLMLLKGWCADLTSYEFCILAKDKWLIFSFQIFFLCDV